jgi:hypothetical protein
MSVVIECGPIRAKRSILQGYHPNLIQCADDTADERTIGASQNGCSRTTQMCATTSVRDGRVVVTGVFLRLSDSYFRRVRRDDDGRQ